MKQRFNFISKKEKGFSILEILISVIVLGFAVAGLINLFMNLAVQNVAGQYRGIAVQIGQELIEEIKAKRFDERTTKDLSGNWSTVGVDTGETTSSKSNYDDVDDYNGWSEAMSSPYSGFTRTVSVIYVDAANLDTSSTRDKDYKKVVVTVTKGGTTYAQLSTLMSAARVQEA